MKNLKILCFTVAFTCILSVNNLFGQGAYVNINAGYSGCMSATNLDYFAFYNYTSAPNSTTLEQVYVSLGKGINIGGTFGYMFNENIGAELGVSYLLGSKFTAMDEYETGTTDYTLSSKMLRINPSLVIASGLDDINPYAEFGLVIGMGSVTYEVDENYDGDKSNTVIMLDGGLALGLSAAIGANFNINDNMSFFAEINMINMSYAPTKGEYTEATYNGTDELPDWTTSEKEIEFVDSYTYFNDNPPSDSEPSQELKQVLPFGSVGLNVGLRIAL